MARRHRQREIERLLCKRTRQGLTYREVSEESGIPIPTLAWWSRKLEREAEDVAVEADGCKLVPVDVVEGELGEDAAIEIALGDRVRLFVPPRASEEHLRRVLRSAMASC